jgi:hypothetical protein
MRDTIDSLPPLRAEDTLPPPLRVARLAEALYVPMGLLLILGLPLDDPLAFALVGAQVAAAAAIFVGLGRRSRLAWIAAMLLASYFLFGILARGPEVARRAFAGETVYQVALVPLVWVFLTQLVVLVSCLALARSWRTVLR